MLRAMLRTPSLPALARVVLVAGALAVAGAASATPDALAADARARFAVEQGLFPDPTPPGPAPEAVLPGAAPAMPSAASSARLAARMRDEASGMVIAAMNFLGVRYKRGGTDVSTGFDCSGFTRHIVETALGHVLPRRADEQAAADGLVAIRREELRPGDLVFFNTLRRTFSHVGIYVGDGKFIHAPRTGARVRVESMGFAYWRKRFTGARRLETLAQEPAARVSTSASAPTLAASANVSF